LDGFADALADSREGFLGAPQKLTTSARIDWTRSQFAWPVIHPGQSRTTLRPGELALLLNGIDLTQTKPRSWFRGLSEASNSQEKTGVQLLSRLYPHSPHHPFFSDHCGRVSRLPGGVAALFSLLPAEFRPTKHDPKT
jgi:hypothetical protein